MQQLDASQLKTAVLAACDRIIESEQRLTELDTIIGDGDHGFGMRVGFSAVKAQLQKTDYAMPFDLMKDVGMTLVKVMGGTSGVIYGTLFLGGLDAFEGQQKVDVAHIASFLDLSAKAIARRGRTQRGDKTMYDALIEASEAFNRAAANGDSVEKAFRSAAESSAKGAEATKSMQSQKGRSKNFREKTIGYPDTGAVSTTIIFEALASAVETIAGR